MPAKQTRPAGGGGGWHKAGLRLQGGNQGLGVVSTSGGFSLVVTESALLPGSYSNLCLITVKGVSTNTGIGCCWVRWAVAVALGAVG